MSRKFSSCQLLPWRWAPKIAAHSQAKFEPAFDPFNYTQGRWLDRDQERRDARKLRFNFDALLDAAVKCSPGARRVTSCDKREGGYNRVFMIRLDNKTTVVARLPTSISGPPSLTVSSEVATLQFVKEKTTVPVPGVLAWSAKPDNGVGAEYMILEPVPGILLRDVWHRMKASEHIECIRSIGRLYAQLGKIMYSAYGSLYLNAEAPPGAVKFDETFCIGPVCAPLHWNCDIDYPSNMTAPPSGFQGPWHNIQDYFSDHVGRVKGSLKGGGISLAHAELLDVFQQTIRLLMTAEPIQNASQPALLHPDLHMRNIFVDTEDFTKITGLIDWQSAAVDPAFVFAADTPDFAAGVDETPRPGMSAEEQAAHAKFLEDVSLCGQAWAVMQQPCEQLRPASHLAPTLLRFLAAPNFGWLDKELALETLLRELAEDWEQMGLPGQSVYQPTPDAVERLDDYKAMRQLQEHLSALLRCDKDGWVSNERWDEVLARYRLEYSRLIESIVQSEGAKTEDDKRRAVEKANDLWPFDQR